MKIVLDSYFAWLSLTVTGWLPRPVIQISVIFENGKALATMSETKYETPGVCGSHRFIFFL